MSDMIARVEAKSRAGTGILIQGKWYNGRRGLLADVNKGDKVKLEVEGQDIVSLKPMSSAEPRSSAPSAAGTSRYDPEREERRQKVILHQAARRDAIDTAFKMLEVGATKLPTKQSDQFDAILALISVIGTKFEEEAMAVYDPNYTSSDTDEEADEDDA